ncbi:MAG: tandem-95 repeat protein, partial [Thiohalomonadales bacterium]
MSFLNLFKFGLLSLTLAYLTVCGISSPEDAPPIDVNDPEFSKPKTIVTIPLDSAITIQWSAVPGATKYTLYWSNQPEFSPTGANKIEINATEREYIHSDLTNGNQYFYSLSANTQKGGESALSKVVSATPVFRILEAPTNFSVQAENQRNTLNWIRAPGASSHTIYWAENNFGTVSAADNHIELAEPPFVHDNLENGKNYHYRIVAINIRQAGTASDVVSARPTLSLPMIPAGISASYDNPIGLSIIWQDVSNASYFNLYWSNSAGVTQSSQQFQKVLPTFIHTPLTPGYTYYYRLSAGNASGETDLSEEFSVTVSATTGIVNQVATSQAKPNIPTGTNFDQGNQQLTLSWDLDPFAKAYNIYWEQGNSGSLQNPSKIANVQPPYTHVGLTNNVEIRYAITAINDAGESVRSDVYPATPRIIVPGVPNNLTALSADGYAVVSWTPVEGAQQYILEVRNDKSDPTADFIDVRDSSSIILSQHSVAAVDITPPYKIVDLDNTTTYRFALRAVNPEAASTSNPQGKSGRSIEIAVTPQVATPTAPVNLVAQQGNTSVTLTWDQSNNVAEQLKNYNVYWSLQPNVVPQTANKISSAILPQSDDNQTHQFRHTGISNGRPVYYVITAENAAGESAPSSEVGAIPQSARAAITATSVFARPGSTAVTVNWTLPVGKGAIDANLYWWPEPDLNAPADKRAITNVGTSSHVISGLENGVRYHFSITTLFSENIAGTTVITEGAHSQEVIATPRFPPPTTPLGGVTTITGDSKVVLTWAADTTATAYKVFWSTSANIDPYQSTFITLQVANFTHTNLTNGSTYYYAIAYQTPGGESPLTAVFPVIPQVDPPTSPTGFTVVPADAQTIVSWGDVPTASSYNLYYTDKAEISFPEAGWLKVSGLNPGDRHLNLKNNTTYRYVVTAVNPGGESGPSVEMSTMPKVNAPSAPLGVSASGSDAQNNLSWFQNTGETYNVYWSTLPGVVPDASLPTVTKISGQQSIFRHGGLVNMGDPGGSPYYYVVTAQIDQSESAPSLETSATPAKPLLGAPTALRAESNNGSVTLHWQNVSDPNASYRIYWTTNANDATSLGPNASVAQTEIGGKSPFLHTPLINGDSYYYKVTAITNGESNPSGLAIGKPQVATVQAPTGISTSISPRSININWPMLAGINYNLYWTDNPSAVSTIRSSGTKIVGVTSPHSFSGLNDGTSRYFVLTAENAAGESASSVNFSATPGVSDNFAPVIAQGLQTSVSMDEDGTPRAFSLSLDATDNDNDSLAWRVISNAVNGTATAGKAGGSIAVNYTPIDNFFGDDLFIVKVDDGRGGTATIRVDVAVNSINDVPVFSGSIPRQSVIQGAEFTLSLAQQFSDVDGDTLTYTATLTDGSPLPAWLDSASPTPFDTATATFAGIPLNADVGIVDILVVADDGNGGNDSASFQLTVDNKNDPPKLVTPLADKTLTQNLAFSFQLPPKTFSDADPNDSLTLSATLNSGLSLPNWLVFDPVTATFSGIPEIPPPSIDIMVTATDTSGATASDAFKITLQNNTPPTFNVGTAFGISLLEDTTHVFTVQAKDNESNPISWRILTQAGIGTASVSNNPTGFNQDITYTPNLNLNGPDTFTIAIWDQTSINTPTELVVGVDVKAQNDRPDVNKVPPAVTFVVGVAKTHPIPSTVFVDVDGDALRITAAPIPAGLKYDITSASFTGSNAGAPPVGSEGTTIVTLTATDPSGLFVTTELSITIGNNNPPTFNEGSAIITTMSEDGTPKAFGLTLNATDIEREIITWSIISNGTNGNATVSGTGPSKVISYKPKTDYFGRDDFTVQITDTSGGSNAFFVTVNIASVNDNPVADTVGITPQTASIGTPVKFTTVLTASHFSDVDLDVLSYSYTPLIPNITLNPNTGVFSGAPVSGPLGTTVITISATDGIVGSKPAIKQFSLTIDPNQPPTLTTITPQTVLEDALSGVVIPMNATDPEGNQITWTNTTPSKGSLAFEGGISTGPSVSLRYTPSLNLNLKDTFTITVTDSNGDSNNQLVTVNITPVNDDPKIDGGVGTTMQTVGVPFTYSIPANAFKDIDGDALTYSATLPLPAGLSFSAVPPKISGTLPVTSPPTTSVSVEIVASDGNGGIDAKDILVINVTGNSTPTISSVNAIPPNPSVLEDSLFANVDIAFTAADTDGNPLTWSIVTGPTNGNAILVTTGSKLSVGLPAPIVGAAGTGFSVSYKPNANFNGSDTFTLQVDDQFGGITQLPVTVVVTPVNDDPKIDGGVGTTMQTVGVPFTYSIPANAFKDIDGDALTYSATLPLPAGLSFSAVPPKISGTLPVTSPPTTSVSVEIVASDGNGGIDAKDILVINVTGNSTPTISSVNAIPPNPSVLEDSLFANVDIAFTAADTDGNPLTWSIVTGPTNGNAILVTTGSKLSVGLPAPIVGAAGTGFSVSYKPNANFNGSDTFTLQVDDQFGGITQLPVTAVVTPVNDAPTIKVSLPALAGTVNIRFSQSIIPNNYFDDVDILTNGDVLSLSIDPATPLPNGITFNAVSNTFEGIPTTATPALGINVNVIATDQSGATNDQAGKQLQNIAIGDNLLPVFDVANKSSVTIFEDAIDPTTKLPAPFALMLKATDPELSPLTWSVDLSLTTGGVASVVDPVITGNSKNFTYIPNPNYNGKDTFDVIATDAAGGSQSTTIAVVVTPVNDAPFVAAAIAAQPASENVTLTIQIPMDQQR